MIKTAEIVIVDECVVKIEGLDLPTRRACVNAVKYFLPHARYSPAYRLGRWDGTQSFCTLGGRTYLNLLDKILPVLIEEGYEFEIQDHRSRHEFDFSEVDENYLSHIKWPADHRMAGQPIMLRDYQIQAINECINNLQGISIAPTSAGKAQPLYSKVRTPNGWKTIGNLNIGDPIMIPDGTTASVIGIFDKGIKDVYEITFEDGRTARSCDEHLWKVHNHNWTNKWKIMKLSDIMENMKTNQRHMSIPLPTMSFDDSIVDLPLDPYLLGAMLGDGSFRHGIGISTSDQFIVDKISSLLDVGYVLKHHNNYDYHVVFESNETHMKARAVWATLYPRQCNGTMIKNANVQTYHRYNATIESLGLKGTYSHNKFIPTEYLTAGYTQRLSLVQGLLDTDGYVDKRGCVSFTTTSTKLADDFANLIRSIGGIAKIKHSSNRMYVYNGERRSAKDVYNVSIYHPDPSILVSLPRKKDRILVRNVKRQPRLNIVRIEKIGSELVRCIMIDHPDHLYVTDNYVVTHNTIITASLSMIAEKYGRTVVIVPNKNLVQQTEEDYRNIGLDVGVLYGDRKEYNRQHTICTWQSLMVLDKKSKDALDDDQLAVFMDRQIAVICDECFDGNMRVLTPTGYIPIKDIKPNDQVINYSESQKIFKTDTVVKQHLNLTNSSTEKMFELEFDDGSIIKVTGNHKFMTNKGWIRADELTNDHEVININTFR